MKLFKILQNIFSEYLLVTVGALMLLVAGAAFFNLYTYWNSPPPPLNAPMTLTFALLAIIPLAWRRLFLVTGLMFIITVFLTFAIFDLSLMNFSSIAAIMSIFCAAVYGGNRRNLACTASVAIYIGCLMNKLMLSNNITFLSSAIVLNIAGLLWSLTTFIATWCFGNWLRLNRERTSKLSEKTLAGKGQKNVYNTLLNGCIHIARKLRDILAYFTIAQGMTPSAVHRWPKQCSQKALNALIFMMTVSQQTILRLYRLLICLRNKKQVKVFSSQSDFQEPVELINDIQSSGFQVDVKMDGEKSEVSMTLDLLSERRIPFQLVK